MYIFIVTVIVSPETRKKTKDENTIIIITLLTYQEILHKTSNVLCMLEPSLVGTVSATIYIKKVEEDHDMCLINGI